MNIKMIIGRRIAKERNKQNISQEQLAHIAGIYRAYIGKVERGEVNLGICNIQKITKALGIKLEELFKNI